jgi:adenosylhomocysteine nucleosidase
MADDPIALLVPVEEEFAPYRRLLPGLTRLPDAGPWNAYESRVDGRRIVAIVCHTGPANAAAATERAILQFAPRAVLHGGSAGAHNHELLPGDIVVGGRYVEHRSEADLAARRALGFGERTIRFRRGDEIVRLAALEADGHLHALARAVAEREAAAFPAWDAPGWPAGEPVRPARVVDGVIASADTWTAEVDALAALRERYGAECEDMETVYVGQICALHHLPFVAVRAISNNDARARLTPEQVMPAIAAAGERAARVLAALAREV